MGKISDRELRNMGENPREVYSENNNNNNNIGTLKDEISSEETKNYIEFKHPRDNGALFYSPRNSLGIHRLSSGAAEEERLSIDLEIVEDLKSSI